MTMTHAYAGSLCLLLAAGGLQAQPADRLTVGQAKPGNIFLTTETVEIPVATSATAVEWRVTDFAGRTFTGPDAPVDGHGQAVIRPKSGHPGYFELHLAARRDGALWQADTAFAVVAPPRETGPAPADSPFGVMTHFAQGWNPDLMPLIARAGLRHIRDEQYWANVEPTRGQYTFPAPYQAYMAAAAKNGLEVLTELTFGNALYDHDPAHPATAFAPCTDEGRAAYDRYALALLGRYGAQIPTVEVWNEYNGTWCDGPAARDRPGFYTRMLQSVYGEIKRQHPGVRVLGGASVLTPLPWFEDLFKDGALDCLDGIVIHPYVGVPEAAGRSVAALRALAARYQHGGPPKPIWATECGEGDAAHPGRQDMARYLVRLMTVLRGEGVERIYWYLMRDYSSFTTGLVRSDRDPLGRYTPTAAYPAYANLIRQLAPARFERREATDRRTRVYRFARDGAELRVAWSTAGSTRLLLGARQPLVVTDLMGETRTLPPTDGQVALPLDDTPVYVAGAVSAVRESRPDRLLADSAEDFGDAQNTAAGGWSYGYYPDQGGPYRPGEVRPMTWKRDRWDNYWGGPAPYSKLDGDIAHPGGGNPPVWSVRRWHSNTAGPVRISGTARRDGPGGDGTGCKIFVDGAEVFSQLLGGHGQPATADFGVDAVLAPDSQVDFVVTPGPGANVDFDAVSFAAQVTAPVSAAATPSPDGR